MRVLWLSNTQPVGANKSVGRGWIGSLETELSKISDIQLGISFNSKNTSTLPFSVGNTWYYPISVKPAKNKFYQLFFRWSHKIESEDNIQLYLDIIQQFNPDLIHIFGTESDYGLIISKTTVPCIIHLQGNLTVIMQKWFGGLTAIDIFKYSNKWRLLKGYGLYHYYYYQKKGAIRENKIYKVCQYFMGRTDWDRRVSSVMAPNSKYFHCDEIMRPGFYLHQWQPQANHTNYIIVSTIRDNIYKGLETIYECIKILRGIFLEYKITWKVAGINEGDEISDLVERKFKDKLVNNNIQLLGPLQENELISELLRADLFVHASHIDNSPNSVCEAMLLGMPVIATFAGGIPSIIEDKKEGLLVQDGDPYAMAGAIIELIKNTKYARSLGDAGRERAMIRHNPDRILNDILNIYSSLISKK